MMSSFIQIQFRWLEALFRIFICGAEVSVFEASFCVCLCLPTHFIEDKWKELKEWLKVPIDIVRYEF